MASLSRETGRTHEQTLAGPLLGGAPIEVIVEGKLRCEHTELVEESDEVTRIYSNILENYGSRGVGRLEVTTTARGLPDVTKEVDIRAGVFLDRPEREEELGDYEEL